MNSGSNPSTVPLPPGTARGNTGQGNTGQTNTGQTNTGQGSLDNPATNSANRGTTDTTTGPIPPAGTEGSTGGATTGNRNSGPATTGTVSGVNRQPGEASAVRPTAREEELFRKGEELERKIERGICDGCTK
jgi:hypothetical protein